jgi:dynein heavy chain, axonemal
VLFTGEAGVGKSVIAASALDHLYSTKNYIPHIMNFSAQTTAKETQLLIESKLEKKRKTRLGAPPNKRIVFFVDDINMPARETYGAQPPIELLRQFQDFKGFYDREKLFWKDIQDVTLCGACAPPGGGRQEVTPRFMRHFAMFCVPVPSESSTKKILSSIFQGFLSDFQLDVQNVGMPIVSAAVTAYRRISEELLPSPTKSHYTFNLRDLCKVFQGMLMVKPQHCKDQESMVRLWVHESLRVFHDRLVDNGDKEHFKRMLAELVSSNLPVAATFEDIFESRSASCMLVCTFILVCTKVQVSLPHN